jgi:hypothetical protein
MRHCHKCSLDKEDSEFYSGRRECKRCTYDSRKEYREEYKSTHNQNNQKYYYSERTNSYRIDPRKYLFKVAKTRAKKQGQPFEICLDDIIIPEKCPILNVDIDFFIKNKADSYKYAASLDRIDNLKGYVPGNVRVISRKANMMKRDLNLEILEKLILYIKGEI